MQAEADVGAININLRLLHLRFAMTVLFIGIISAFLMTDASAEDYARAQTYIHNFNNNNKVLTAVFALNKDINLDTNTYFKYTVDIINPRFEDEEDEHGTTSTTATSGASTASGGGAKDVRNELTAGVTHNFNNIAGVELYYDYSKENDYTSHTPSLTLKKDLLEKNTTLTMSYSRNMDKVYGKFMNGEQGRNTDNYFFGVTQILSPLTIAQLGYSRSNVIGFHSDGVRLVPLNGVSPSSCTDRSASCADEAFPDNRKRDAVVFGINQFIPNSIIDRSSIKFTYRYYNDDWNIASNTEEIEYNEYITEDTILRVNFRYYDQTQANFIKDTYISSDLYKSSSPQFKGFNSQLFGLKLTNNFLREGSFEGKYEYYSQSINVYAHVFMLTLKLAF